MLRQFDLAWQYGPCTGENPSAPRACAGTSPVTHMSLKQPKPLRGPLRHCLLSLGSVPTQPPHTLCGLDSSPPTLRPRRLLPSPAGITRLQRWHRAEQMGLEPPPEVRQVLQTHLGDPRFQFRSEAGQGGLSGGPGPSPGTAGLLTLGVGAALACRADGCWPGGPGRAGTRVLQGVWLRRAESLLF